jgi:hypothetical protein
MLVTADCRFHQAASAVAGCFLPAHAALLRDHSDMPVALALPVSAVCAQHCRCARRNHHVWWRIVLLTCHGLVDRLAILCAIRDEAGNLAADLLEQSGNFAYVVYIILGQSVRNNLTGVRVDREMELAP